MPKAETRTKAGTKPVKFVPYDTMTNKIANWSTSADVAWIATPKIHGTNMSVTIIRDSDIPSVKFARRHAYLEPGTAFMGYERVLPGLATWTDFLGDFPDSVQAITIFGEFFGGSYPGHEDGDGDGDVKDPPIQKGVHYSSVKRFAAFDIRTTPGGFLDFSDVRDLCERHGVPHVLPAISGTFEEVSAWARAHARDDVDPSLYQVPGLPILPGNGGEGWVIRPVKELPSTLRHVRVMVKIKNPLFSESARISGVARVKAGPADSRIVTAARVANVLGKELPDTLTFANIRSLIELVVADAQKDEAAGETQTHDAEDPEDPEEDPEPREDPALTKKAAGAFVRTYLDEPVAARKGLGRV
jgi:Rnl2 family RNA ligase